MNVTLTNIGKKGIKYLIYIILVLLIFGLGMIVSSFWYHYDKVSQTLYSFKITDIMQILVTIFVALYVAHIIQSRSSREIKKCDIAIEHLSKFQSSIETIYEIGTFYIKNKTPELSEKILSDFDKAGHILTTIFNAKDSNYGGYDSLNQTLKDDYRNFKNFLTNDPFETEAPYSPELIEQYESSYDDLILKIIDCKNKVYDV